VLNSGLSNACNEEIKGRTGQHYKRSNRPLIWIEGGADSKEGIELATTMSGSSIVKSGPKEVHAQ